MNSPVKLNPNHLRIFHEIRKRRIFVGELIYDAKKDQYELIYDESYANSKSAIPLSPDLHLFKLHHKIKGKLFPAFEDRIPDRSNPAYPDLGHRVLYLKRSMKLNLLQKTLLNCEQN